MKNFKILGLALLSLFIFSCTEDDDGGTTDPNQLTNANLAGTYNVTAFSATGSETDTSGSTPDVSSFDIVGSDFNNVTFTFTEGGRVTTAGTFTTTATITEDGMTFNEIETTDIDLDGTYSISGNSLILSNSDGATVTIRNFSSAGLELFIEQTDIEPDYRFEAMGSYTLVRQ